MGPTEIEVLYFAVAREKTGVGEEVFPWSEDLNLEMLLQSILGRHPSLVPFMPHIRIAVDEEFVRDMSLVLSAGQTIALIPPVSGGQPSYLTTEPLVPAELEMEVINDSCGAVVTFTGRVRNHTGAHAVTHLDYEAYGPMAERKFRQLIEQVKGAYPTIRIALKHRIGRLVIGDIAVAIAVAAPHRADAFGAAQTLIDELKNDVPIFKKEARLDGSVWVGIGS
ncbi:MAG: molybdenum cofactor biosynthesis protein MoaE [Myxococcota bacterium]|nr:molybdenum cofactor biosynthesis protein MoaE [Myxococcota bacterium]